MGALSNVIAVSKLKEYEARKERHDKAQALVDEGKLFQAVKLFKENLDWSLASFGQDHQTTVYDQETLAYAVSELGHLTVKEHRGKKDKEGESRIKALFEEAQALDEKALETRTRVEGTSPPSIDLLDTQRNLANDHLTQNHYHRAVDLFLKNYEARRTHPELGDDHESTLRAGHDLAGVWHNQGKYEMAKTLNQKVLDARIRLKKSEVDIGKSRNQLYWNNQMIEDRKKKRAEEEKKAAANEKKPKESWKENDSNQGTAQWTGSSKQWKSTESSWTAKKGNATDGNKESNTKQIEIPEAGQAVPIPSITFKYVDPRVSVVNQVSPEASTSNLPFRRGSGQGSRPSTPKIVEADPNQRRNKPRPTSWVQDSKDWSQTKTSNPSENLKPAGKNPGNKKEPTRARSHSTHKDKDTSKPRRRAKSTSPSSSDRNHFRQLSDLVPGSDDKVSSQAVDSWFYSLNKETQGLLNPLRRSRGKRVKIAILDTGIDKGHPHFSADQAKEWKDRRIKSCEDFLDPDGNAQDNCGHGTHCVGLLRKVAPEADIYIARVAKDFDGNLNPDIVAKAILRACRGGKDENGKWNWNVDIITMSFGFYGFSKVVQTAIQEALAKPVLVFAAASNNGTQREVTFPAWVQGVFCICSATASGTPSFFNPDVKPPKNFSIIGENIKSTWIRAPDNQNSERVMSGTSVATPIAAGVAALVLEYVLRSDPEGMLIEHWEDLKGADGMPRVFSLMVRSEGKYNNVVPWVLLSAAKGETTVTSFIRDALRHFRAE